MSDITKILGEIDKLKDQLDQTYSKKITIMFTDIKDSTVYFEKHGDMNGRMLIEKHNSLLFPIVEKYGGTIIKTIGDAIMAKFDFALNGTKAAIEMQRTLKDYNVEARDKIRVRIGLHTGKAIVEEGDVFGDSVNLAARIEAGTKAEFITISKNTLVDIAAYKNIKVEKLGVVKYKGKEEEIETYSVLWDSTILEKKVRGEKTWLYDSLLVKVTIENNKVKVRYRYYLNDNKKEEVFDNIDKKLFSKFLKYLEQLRSSTLQKDSTTFDLDDFKKEGVKIYKELFSFSINEIFKKSDLKYLVIDTDPNFSFFPFDLLYDGTEFLGLKYPIFRLIDHFKKVEPKYSYFTFLDYTLDEEVAQEKEFSIINNTFKNANLSMYSPNKEYAKLDDLTKKLSEIIKKSSHLHFAFHNLFSINFDDIKFKNISIDYKNVMRKNAKLRYIIANSCKTTPILTKFISRENNFLTFLNDANLKLYLGNFFNIYDEVGLYFSEIFYDYMLKGYSYPEAVYKSKLKLKEKYGENSLIWASYTIFADSVESVLETMIDNTINVSQETIAPAQEIQEIQNKEKIRGTADVIDASPLTNNVSKETLVKETIIKNESSTNKILLIAILLILVLGVGFFIYKNSSNNSNNSNTPAIVTKDDNRKDASTATSLKKKTNNRKDTATSLDKKEDLIVYDGIQQSDIKADTKDDNKVAIKNTKLNNRLVVLYFDNTSKNRKLDPLRKGLADMLISDISDLENVGVVERERLEDIIKELNLSKTKYIDRKSALKIGRMLSAKYIMVGSFLDPPIDGLPLRVDAKVIDVETSKTKWAKGIEGDKKDLYKIEKKIFKKFKESKFVKNLKASK